MNLSESDVAKAVIEDLKAWKWEVYQEVNYYGRVADIVAVRGHIQWAIETKTSFGLKVMEQAFRWKGICHYASIAVPKVKNTFGQFLCRQHGIGVITLLTEAGKPWGCGGSAMEIIKPGLSRRIVGLELNEKQKYLCEAGSAKGGHWTPFKETCDNLVKAVKRSEGMEFSHLIERIDHHYASYHSARSCLKGFIGTVIPELKLVNVNGKLCVFLSGDL